MKSQPWCPGPPRKTGGSAGPPFNGPFFDLQPTTTPPAACRDRTGSRGAGESRTHTGADLNRVPLPLGYGPVRSMLEVQVSAELRHVPRRLHVVLRDLNLPVGANHEG